MHDVFISYAREDIGVASQLAAALQPYHLSVFHDVETLVSGEEFSAQVAQEIAEARAVVVLLSHHAQRNRWVKQELVSALEQDKIVVSLLLDNEATHNWIWPLVSDRLAIEVDETTDYDELALQLRRAITRVEKIPTKLLASQAFRKFHMGNLIGLTRLGGTAVVQAKQSSMAESFHAVDDMTWADRDQHHRLKVLLANLEAALEEMPATHSEDAQRITEMTEILVSESSRKSPHASYLKLGAEGLLEAASAIQDISPEAMHAASEIAQLLGPEQ